MSGEPPGQVRAGAEDRGAEGPLPLPLAMAAVTVAGQCRERSPGDLVVFGPDAVRFADRFADRQAGERMLAEAVRDGLAEQQTELCTLTGGGPFRVSLWRQRGGDRIRLLGCFAQIAECAPGGDEPSPTVPAEHVGRFADQLRLPLAAIAGFAERLRHGGDTSVDTLAGDILAASWRISRLADDLRLLAELDGQVPPLRMGEVDVARLSRRVLRLAEPLAEAAGVRLEHDLGHGSGPSVLADESSLWSVIESLVQAGIAACGKGATLSVGCAAENGDLVLQVASASGLNRGAQRALALAEAMSRSNGVRLELIPANGFGARLVFPKERCLSPI